jgi:tRNA(Arg) A34 adenosine deaminase TadA
MENPFNDTYFMKKALQEAEMAFDKGEIPVGAVIVINNTIIARSHNLTELLHDVTAHAEMQAITAAAIASRIARGIGAIAIAAHALIAAPFATFFG